MPATNQLVHNSFGKPMFDLEAQGVVLKSWNSHSLNMRRELALRHRLVAFSEAGNEHQCSNQGKEANPRFHKLFRKNVDNTPAAVLYESRFPSEGEMHHEHPHLDRAYVGAHRSNLHKRA